MPALPRHKDTTSPRDAFKVIVLGGLESMTTALRRGDAINAQSVAEIEAVCNRADALRAALESRLAVLEDEE